MSVNLTNQKPKTASTVSSRPPVKQPSAVWRIARKEFIETSRDGRFRFAAGIISLLLILSLLSGWLYYREAQAQHRAAQQAERERWLNQGEKSPHSGAHYGIYVFKPQMPLLIVDRGIEPYTGVTAHLEAHKQNIFQYKPAEDSSATRRFGELTAATTLQVLIPVLIVLLAFTTFAGEREQGTLRQLLSLGVRQQDLAFGKALGTISPLLVILLPAAVIGVAALGLSSGANLLFDNFSRLLLMTGGYLIYFALFVGLTLTISALAASSRQALVILLGFWFINCLMAPPVVTDLARLIYPTPAALDFAASIREDELQVTTWYKRLAEVETRLLERYQVDSVEKLPVSPKGIAQLEAEAATDKIQEAHFNALHKTHDRQTSVYQTAGIFAPTLAVQSLSMGLTGTDFAQHRHFAEHAEAYRRELVRLMNEDDAANSKPGDAPYLPNVRGSDLWEKVPPFQYAPPTLGWVVSNQLPNILILLLWFAGIAVVTVIAVSKLKVS